MKQLNDEVKSVEPSNIYEGRTLNDVLKIRHDYYNHLSTEPNDNFPDNFNFLNLKMAKSILTARQGLGMPNTKEHCTYL